MTADRHLCYTDLLYISSISPQYLPNIGLAIGTFAGTLIGAPFIGVLLLPLVRVRVRVRVRLGSWLENGYRVSGELQGRVPASCGTGGCSPSGPSAAWRVQSSCAKDLGTDCYTYKSMPSVHGSAAWSSLVCTSLEEQTVQTSAQTSAERLVQRD